MMMKPLASVVLPILADLTGVGLFLWLGPVLLGQFGKLGFFNSVLLGLFFVLFCLAVYAMKKLQPESPRPGPGWLTSLLASRRALAVLGVLFALTISLATAYTTGFLDSVVRLEQTILDEPSATIYLLLTPASWFGLALVYMLMLSTQSEQIVPPFTPRYYLLSYLGLVGVNLMAVVLTAVWQALFVRFPPAGGSPLPGLLLFLLYLGLFFLFCLIYVARVSRPGSLITFLLFLALLVASAGV